MRVVLEHAASSVRRRLPSSLRIRQDRPDKDPPWAGEPSRHAGLDGRSCAQRPGQALLLSQFAAAATGASTTARSVSSAASDSSARGCSSAACPCPGGRPCVFSRQFHAVDEPGAAVVQQVIGRQPQRVEAVADLSEPRIHSFAEHAVDLLAPLRLGQQHGELGDGLVAELKRTDAPRPARGIRSAGPAPSPDSRSQGMLMRSYWLGRWP